MCESLFAMLWDGGSKFGDAQRHRFQLMPQFQAQVPDPLGDALPGFLAPGRVAAPAVGVLLSVFVCQYRLKGPAMQVEFDDIDSGNCVLWQVREEEFVDDARTPHANRALLFARRMRCHNHAAAHPAGASGTCGQS